MGPCSPTNKPALRPCTARFPTHRSAGSTTPATPACANRAARSAGSTVTRVPRLHSGRLRLRRHHMPAQAIPACSSWRSKADWVGRCACGGGAVGGRVGHVSTTGHFALMPAYPSAVLSLLHTHGHAHGARTHAHGARTHFHSHSTPSLSTQVASKPDLHDGC